MQVLRDAIEKSVTIDVGRCFGGKGTLPLCRLFFCILISFLVSFVKVDCFGILN